MLRRSMTSAVDSVKEKSDATLVEDMCKVVTVWRDMKVCHVLDKNCHFSLDVAVPRVLSELGGDLQVLL